MARSILLADDSVTIRRIVDLAFRDTGILVVAVGSGADAIDRLRTSRPDVVLADVSMPAPDGYDVCREVKASTHPVPVLLLRGAFDPFDAARAETCGADGTLTKPFEADRLVERVRSLIGREDGGRPPTEDDGAGAEPVRSLDEIARAEPGPPRSAGPVAETAPPPAETRSMPPSVEGAPEEPREVPVHIVEPPPPAATPDRRGGPDLRAELSDEQIDLLVERIVRRMTDRVVREIAWEVVPDLASAMIRQRLREIETGEGPESD